MIIDYRDALAPLTVPVRWTHEQDVESFDASPDHPKRDTDPYTVVPRTFAPGQSNLDATLTGALDYLHAEVPDQAQAARLLSLASKMTAIRHLVERRLGAQRPASDELKRLRHDLLLADFAARETERVMLSFALDGRAVKLRQVAAVADWLTSAAMELRGSVRSAFPDAQKFLRQAEGNRSYNSTSRSPPDCH